MTPREMYNSLHQLNNNFLCPTEVDVLSDSRNSRLLEYVSCDPFGSHNFPGDVMMDDAEAFFSALNDSLEESPPLHVFGYVPLCEARCAYCQFPLEVLKKGDGRTDQAESWVNLLINEIGLWGDRLPNLKATPVSELNMFGGTPTLLAVEQLDRILDAFRMHLNLESQTTLRIEGTPETMTGKKLRGLKSIGFNKISMGVQTLDSDILRLSGRWSSKAEIFQAIKTAKDIGFSRVSCDLIYGLPGQSVEIFIEDCQSLTDLGVDCLVITKLHLRPFGDTRSAIAGGTSPGWHDPRVRSFLEQNGKRWPSLGEVYQMRSEAVSLLTDRGYYEYPTMYFNRCDAEPDRWKRIIVDQGATGVEIGMGLGGSVLATSVEAVGDVNPDSYRGSLARDELPIQTMHAYSTKCAEGKAVRMALSTCQDLHEAIHAKRFPSSSLFHGQWGDVFTGLETRGLVSIDQSNGIISLTRAGRSLVEAVMHAEIH